jgi:hypothetical protein
MNVMIANLQMVEMVPQQSRHLRKKCSYAKANPQAFISFGLGIE